MARYLVQPPVEDIRLADVMRALSEDVRLRLVSVLADGEFHSCKPEEFEVGVHKSTLSHHFKVLREAGVTTTHLDGRNHSIRLRREDLNARFPGLLDAVLHELASRQAVTG
ncbi:ArsR family transcriptional regulator [Actinosynnema sp. NPDC020468]|uniref:ArsR/SmtB family transcription factor n=1 Tax=Actinosynnema sp. NPDC020468 TaxID=3154488 RepID=UPI00340491CC